MRPSAGKQSVRGLCRQPVSTAFETTNLNHSRMDMNASRREQFRGCGFNSRVGVRHVRLHANNKQPVAR